MARSVRTGSLTNEDGVAAALGSGPRDAAVEASNGCDFDGRLVPQSDPSRSGREDIAVH